MRKLLPLLAAIPTAALLAFIFPNQQKTAGQTRQTAQITKITAAFRCSPTFNPLTQPNNITPLSGWGNYKWPIKTSSDSAQYYFNQGISMYYAFHIIEARASFAKVTELDPQCAMGWWALALSFGPNINDFEYNAPEDALTAARKAGNLANFYTPKEKALVHAINTRYSENKDLSRDSLNKIYAAAMKQAYKDLPQDADIATLYADALMLLHPWDLYDHDSKPKPWTPELVQVLEHALKLNPDNPGANHYYIHAVEASANPGKALPSADRLAGLMPDVSHVVHMPSHIYIRTGHYEKGASLNEQAITGFVKYVKVLPAVEENEMLYNTHNAHMEAACNLMAGDYYKSLGSGIKANWSVREKYLSIPGPLGHFAQYVYSTPIFVMVRYGKWDDILQTKTKQSGAYMDILLHFAKGLAYAKTGQPAFANNELTTLRVKMNEDESLKEPFTPFNSAYHAIRIAENLLAGTIAQESGQMESAIGYFQKAVALEDEMVYNEPRDWLLPARHYLGNALLKAGKFAEAEVVYKKDLIVNPLNGWALTGLHQAQTGLKKTAEAKKTLEQLQKAWGKDPKIKSSVL